METLHAPGMYVNIHGKYAEQLGYSHLQGAMGIIDDVMSALCGVVILSGPAGHTFVKEDIHIEDCELLPQESGEEFRTLININTGHIFYSKDVKLVQFARGCMHQSSLREIHNLTGVDEIHDFCDIFLAPAFERLQEENPDFDWAIHNLDDMSDPESAKFNRVYQAFLARKQAEQPNPQSVEKMANLLKTLRQQVEITDEE